MTLPENLDDITVLEIRLKALDRALPLCHENENEAVRIAKLFEAYLSGETV